MSASARRLGLGTVQFGLPYGISNETGQVPLDEAGAIVHKALSAGVEVLDTAAAYGTSEQVLAAALPTGHGARIVSKTLPLARGGLEATLSRLQQSISLLGPLEAILVHAAQDLSTPDGPALWRSLHILKDRQLVRRIGISAYFDDQPLELAARWRPDLMQLPVSLLDQRLVADGTLARLAERGVDVHARSLFLQGLLFLAPEALPPRLAHAGGQLAAIRETIAGAGSTPLCAAVGFVLAQREIGAAIVGVTTVAELDDILAATALALPPGFDSAACAIDDPLVLTPSLW